MLRQVPAYRLYMNKRILQVKEMEDKVVIHCSDNTEYDCDILVGADGAYSATRQNIQKEMDAVGLLPKSDKENLVAASLCMVGSTGPLDPEKYPVLKDSFVQHRSVQGGNRQGWNVYNIPGNRMCWAYVVGFEDPEEAKRQQFANSEWGPESIEPMIKQIYDKPCPYGGKMGDLIDATERSMISKVFLEHKHFETWFYKRTVLIGDACHKMLPSAGLGAVCAMQDAVILANCLYDLKSNSQEDVTVAFQSYYDQRYPQTKLAYDASMARAKLMKGQRWHEKLTRHVIFNYVPDSVMEAKAAKSQMYRPQASFLPTVPFRGTAPVLPLIPSERYKREQAAKRASQQVQAAISV
ncbi:hypothetical protein EMPS_04510 [Entomortierella parvispora]|uniref:FAD-binding domain-containing protein n=1 Tax=Entomortierella parvispora TaxID=205924 RepID=A0A9P3H9B1_9FUNG|nr:hypothetical protein EMPS_04510 [Entomortierella parvispora]